MTRYRICPQGDTSWSVQRRLTPFIWIPCYAHVGSDYFELITFDSETAAEDWILRANKAEIETWLRRETARRRRDDIKPRVYP